jgi:hypothetical protein
MGKPANIYWYETEAEATTAHEAISAQLARKTGQTYVGGWRHGELCGRDTSFDYTTEDGTKLYAVSD